MDDGTPVTEDYKERDNKFTGKIHSVVIALKPMNVADHAEEHKLRTEASLKKSLAD
jgi:hypothetical protein